jgi:hypothetical protein
LDILGWHVVVQHQGDLEVPLQNYSDFVVGLPRFIRGCELQPEVEGVILRVGNRLNELRVFLSDFGGITSTRYTQDDIIDSQIRGILYLLLYEGSVESPFFFVFYG